MKNIILICMLSIHALGHCFNHMPKTTTNRTILEVNKTEPFLTSFIEGDQLYLNIPDQWLEVPMMFVRYDHSKDNKYIQIIWSLNKDKIILSVSSIKSTSGVVLPIIPKLNLSENILKIFPRDKDRSILGRHCINITDLVLNEDIPWKTGFEESPVPQISMILEAKDLKDEVIIKTRRGVMMDKSKISLPMYFAFCGLDKPMKARRYDYRMGFYNERVNDIYYGTHNRIANISRWRLEKKYPDQAYSVPVKPITFILSPDIPKQWRPYVKAGIEEWLPAFEDAGFKEALTVKEVDSLSDWEMNSINNNIVYWGSKTTLRGNEGEGFGGNVSNIIDERTGEILKGDVYMGTSREAYSEMYFVRAAPLDKRAQTFPFPDNLVGELYQCMVAHEAGHVFGLMDANYGEFAYPFEKMNDVKWLKTMGHTPSVMNYTRQNNVAQPEDSIPPSLLNQKVGPMDRYQIRWAYTEFSSETTKEEVDAALENIIRLQDSVPWYRFNHDYEGIGPASTDEVVESRDPVRAAEMIFKNLERVMALLPNVCNDQKDNTRLERLYVSVIELWYAQLWQVAYLVGGYDIRIKSFDQPGNQYQPIALSTQKQALEFLIQNVFYPPKWLIEPEFESRINYSVNSDKILEHQLNLVLELLQPPRLKRLEYMNTINGYENSFQDFFATLQSGIFQELYTNGSVSPRNQEIQLTYIDMVVRTLKKERLHITVDEKMNDFTDFSKGLLMEQLMRLKKEIISMMMENKINKSVGHWELCLLKLKDIP